MEVLVDCRDVGFRSKGLGTLDLEPTAYAACRGLDFVSAIAGSGYTAKRIAL